MSGRQGRRPMCKSLGASPVAALTELLKANFVVWGLDVAVEMMFSGHHS